MLKILMLLMMTTMVAAPVAAESTTDILATPTCTYIKDAGGNLSGCTTNEPAINKNGGLATQIVNAILFFAGIVALIFILVAGFRYLTSTGDSTRIQSAKDTLLYAVIGLIVTFLAAPIADFVIAKVAGG